MNTKKGIGKMSGVSYKTGFFLAYQLLDALYSANGQVAAESAYVLRDWCVLNDADLQGSPEFTTLRDCLSQSLQRIDEDENASTREYNTLRAPLVALLEKWVSKLKITLYLRPGMPSKAALCIKDDVQPVVVRGDYSEVPDTDENSIHMTLTLEAEDLDELVGKIDVNITSSELFKRARFCFPMDLFDYDRIYLSGKLQSLMTSRNDTAIVLAGSSYAVVGINEHLMPRPAINLAINAQDPYFSFLSIKAAVKQCKKIDYAVITGGYYFWHTDMSDDPSDYYISVLTRTNYPVLGKMHNYKGGILPAMQQSHKDPFLESIFDLGRVYKKEHNRTSIRLASLDYYGTELNVRPPYGMLKFPFREQSDEVNNKAAQLRAKGHNRIYSVAHLEENIGEFSRFVLQMEKKRVKVLVLIPPATSFYRQFSAPELRDTFYKMLEPMRGSNNFNLVDLFDSPEFDDNDFQDYDHLNDYGAVKLSKMVARVIKT